MMMGTHQDITERKRAEDELRIFRESVENSSDAVGISTPEGKHYYQNRAFDELFGPVGENPPESVFVDPAIGHEVFRTIMAGGQWTGEVQMYARDKRILDVLLRAYASKDKSGRTTSLVGIHTDITDRKRAEEEARQQTRALAILNEVITAANRAGDLPSLLDVILKKTLALLDYDAGGIYITDHAAGTAMVVVSHNLPEAFLEKVGNVSIHQPPYDTLLVKGQPIITEHYEQVSPEHAKETWFSSVASVPLVSGDRIIGALNVVSTRRDVVTEYERETLISIGKELGATIERISKEEEAKKSAANLRILFNSIDEMVFILGMDGTILIVNDTVQKKLQYSREEMTGKNVLFLHVPERREEAGRILQGIIAGTVDSCPVPVVAKDGTRIEVETRVTRGWWDNHEVLIGVTRDITERKRIEEALRESERKYRTLFDKTKDAFLIIENNRFVDCNAAALQMLGYTTKEELFETHPSQLSPLTQPDGRASFEKAEEMIAIAMREGSHRFEWVHRRANGEDFWAEVSLTAIPMQDHMIIHTAWRDITDRKKAEKDVESALAYNRSVIEANPDQMVVLDMEGRILDINSAGESVTGIPVSRLIGQLYFKYLEDDGTLETAFARLIAEGSIEITVRIRHTDGHWTPHSVHATVVKGTGGTGDRIIVAAHDITKQRADEEAIRAALNEKIVLLREVHHRVKNNLQIIISLVNLQLRQLNDPQLKQVMAETQNRVKAMAIVHEKLYQSESLSQIDLADYVRYLATQLFSFYGTNSLLVRLDVDIPKTMIGINTAIPLGLVINELVSNALKYAFPGGRKGMIAISGRFDGDFLIITVQDDGIGIPAGMDWINAETLGMRLVNSLVDQIDGKIDCRTDGGTMFIITFHPKDAQGESP
jgi:PAS domain S-box-containing protein